MSLEVQAFAPGRVNLIGEHTDYNGGLALPFAIAEGVTVRARVAAGPIRASALDIDEHDEFLVEDLSPRRHRQRPSSARSRQRRSLAQDRQRPSAARNPQRPLPASGWRAFVRGVAAELSAAGVAVPGAELEIHGDVPRGSGLSSSAALEVALALALLALAHAQLDRLVLARLCSRVESEWVGARTGLLDQLASLCGEPDTALLIDFTSLEITPVPLVLGDGWRIVTLDSGDPRSLAMSGYNERRAECARACELLGVSSLRELEYDRSGKSPGTDGPQPSALAGLPERLARRVRHVLDENARVRETVLALRASDLGRVGALLDDSHASLRDQYECSTPAVEATVDHLRRAGAVGARLVGGGFGGSVLALFPPDAEPPAGAHGVRPSRAAYVQDERA